MTVPEAHQALRVCRGTLYRMIRRGDITIVKLRGRTFIEHTEINRLIERGRRCAPSGASIRIVDR